MLTRFKKQNAASFLALALAMLFSLLQTSFASTLSRLSPAHQAAVENWRESIDSLEKAAQRHQMILSNVADIRPLIENVSVPATLTRPDIKLYIYRPTNVAKDKALPAIYFTHGGGYIMGTALQSSAMLQELANQFNLVAISVEYRLATVAPFPADLEDAYAGLKYVQEKAKDLGINPNQIILMGESAGGGLAARLAIYTRDQAELIAPMAQVLIYPMLDYRTGTQASPYAQDTHTGEFVWTAKSNQFGWHTLAGGQEISPQQMPYFSPALAKNLKDLPRTYISVGDLDLFVHEDIDYANRLISAGVTTRLNVIPNFYHFAEGVVPDSAEAKQHKQFLALALQEILAIAH